MPDPKTKLAENRMHLFDPVGLINDGYGTYWSSNHAIRPQPPTKSCEDTNNNATQGLKSHEKSLSETNSRVGLLSFDALTHTNSFTIIDDVNDLNVGEIRLQVKTSIDQQDESDVSTPKLWKPNSPTRPKSVNSSPSHPASPESVNSSPLQPVSPRSSVVSSTLNVYNHNQYQTMSPSSRTQAIAKGRKELMEMVRDLPESFYELSLKDLVEKKPEMQIPKEVYLQQPEEKKEDEEITKPMEKKKEKKEKKKSKKKVKKSESKKKMVRSRSVDNGRFLLRTLVVFPIFSRSKKGKKKVTRSSSLKVAPMPKAQPTTTNGSMKGVDKEWWRRKSCISSESEESNGLSSSSVSSESSSSSSRSNSNNRRRNRRFLSSCCFFNGTKVKGKK